MSIDIIDCLEGGVIDDHRNKVADMFLWKGNGFIWLYRN